MGDRKTSGTIQEPNVPKSPRKINAAEDVFEISDVSKVNKQQLLISSLFEEALKAQDAVDTSRQNLVYRPHYIKKNKEGEITREHEQYNLTYAMMLGIRHSVQSWSEQEIPNKSRHRTLEKVPVKEMKRGVEMHHFYNAYKTVFPPGGGDMTSPNFLKRTPPHLLKDEFKFKDYAPEIFARLRKRFEIDDGEYLESLCGSFNFLEFISNSKSGEFFFYSHDARFVIKTQRKRESKFMLNMLPDYFNYVADHPNSMLVRVCGAHRVKLPHLRRKMHFVIMMSVFADATDAKPVNRIYDLKGATLGRWASENEAVKKDVNITQEGTKFHLGKNRAAFLKQVESDSKFLARVGVMDYSLLVGIHENPRKSQQQQQQPPHPLLGKSTTTTSTGGGLSQTGSFVFRSDRKSNLGLNSSSSTLTLMNDTPMATSDLSSHNNGPSLPTTFSKHQIRSSQMDLPLINEASPSPRNHADLVAESISLRIAAASESGPSPNYIRGTMSRDGALNSFYRIESVNPNGAESGLIYHMGIIDIFTRYNATKQAEHVYKSVIRGKGDQVSSVNPRMYQKRFVKFISGLAVED